MSICTRASGEGVGQIFGYLEFLVLSFASQLFHMIFESKLRNARCTAMGFIGGKIYCVSYVYQVNEARVMIQTLCKTINDWMILGM